MFFLPSFAGKFGHVTYVGNFQALFALLTNSQAFGQSFLVIHYPFR